MITDVQYEAALNVAAQYPYADESDLVEIQGFTDAQWLWCLDRCSNDLVAAHADITRAEKERDAVVSLMLNHATCGERAIIDQLDSERQTNTTTRKTILALCNRFSPHNASAESTEILLRRIENWCDQISAKYTESGQNHQTTREELAKMEELYNWRTDAYDDEKRRRIEAHCDLMETTEKLEKARELLTAVGSPLEFAWDSVLSSKYHHEWSELQKAIIEFLDRKDTL